MDKEVVATILAQGGKLLSQLLKMQATPSVREDLPFPEIAPAPDPPPEESIKRSIKQPSETAPSFTPITTNETVLYQRREISKELILLEGHLQQGCKINDRACDCCEKHPLKIEGLAQETAGMTADPVYSELADWTRSIATITSEEAAASGQYDEEYPKLAMKAREFRKAIMPDMEVKDARLPEEPADQG